MIRALAVIVPAHDEEAVLGPCLRAIGRALEGVRQGLDQSLCVVALDSCRDGSAALAGDALPGVRLTRLEARCVGTARHAATAAALSALPDTPLDQVWIASTDADSVVDDGWLKAQLAHADAGIDAVAGLVRISDWRGRAASLSGRFAAYLRDSGTRAGHSHVHGANLGVRASAYLRAGGWPALHTGEDLALWWSLRRSGAAWAAAPEATVTTSARRGARAPLGFASFLDELERTPA